MYTPSVILTGVILTGAAAPMLRDPMRRDQSEKLSFHELFLVSRPFTFWFSATNWAQNSI